jgi:hypothetical protein
MLSMSDDFSSRQNVYLGLVTDYVGRRSTLLGSVAPIRTQS